MSNKTDEPQILEASTINEFINEYTAAETIRLHRRALKKYFTFVNVNLDSYVIDIRLLGRIKKINATDQYEKDITAYKNYLIKEDYAPKTIQGEVSSIRLLLEHHHIDLDNSFWRKLDKRGTGKGKGAISDFKVPSPQDLRKILTHATTRARAIFLLQATSGMRLGEICALKLSDIDLSFEYRLHPVMDN